MRMENSTMFKDIPYIVYESLYCTHSIKNRCSKVSFRLSLITYS